MELRQQADHVGRVTPSRLSQPRKAAVGRCEAPARVYQSLANVDELSAALAVARQGDDTGFRALYQAGQPALLRYLTVLVGADAEDVASEAWLHIVRDIRSFRD